ncbi:MAG TPA: flavodoxin domain-containing protein [Candidatus Sulfomarinibacteraceae bacterium]|nr:flavodoxin domain-containing protein [Candidatus Sulfomarinibacteraceae bacterium]
MKRVLVTYATMAGSTAEVAQAVAEELAGRGLQADTLPLRDVHSLDGYDAVVLGAPMIMGWHREATRFLKRQRRTLQQIPLALFVTAISLTETGETSVDGVPVTVDEELPKPPQNPQRLSFRERYARLSSYVRPILKAAGPARPATIGFFGGRLEYGRVPWWAVLFVMFIIQATAGDRRNWPAIRGWAAQLPAALRLIQPQTEDLSHVT